MGVLEALLPGNWDSVNQDRAVRNFQRLNTLFGLVKADSDGFGFTVAGFSVRFAQATLTWPGATQFSNGLTVTHGMGKTPVGVLVSGNLGVLSGLAAWAGTPGATTFVLQGWNPAGSPGAGATDKVFWVAIG